MSEVADRIAAECPRGSPAAEHAAEHGLRHGFHINTPARLACITTDAYWADFDAQEFRFFLSEDQKALLQETGADGG